ncbi:gamma-interferon-responsive lysosomal thiol protein-like [Bidens hawaiensis]|uniref:gamma-interferon-responsive lysosomal thiol protein-like n=1 Tax=Bidens hawaiensis TaxID=980011 RepID=UPI00404908C8
MDYHRRSSIAIFLLIVSSLVVVEADDHKVKLTLYYEALCPSCADFIVNDLYKIFDDGLISIVDLKLSPYGNAKISSNGTIVCQHGEWECALNTVEACAIHAWPAVSGHFPFVSCVEKLNLEERYTKWNTCFKKLDLDPKPIVDCYKSGIGHKLELQYADETAALKPPHKYVPWVVVDGKPLYDDYTDFISFICKAYKGSKVPRACLGISRPFTAPTDNTRSLNHVCYKGKDVKSKGKSTLLEAISSTVASWMIM